VGAALQGYFRGFPSIAVSAPRDSSAYLDMAARVASILASRMASVSLPSRLFLNVNLPDVDPAEIAGVKITRLARESHINSVEEGNRWRQKCYWLVRERLDSTADENTDIRAVEQGNISVTPLYINRADRPLHDILEGLRDELLRQLEGTLKTGKAKA
jgi:5'-nucleotidase